MQRMAWTFCFDRKGRVATDDRHTIGPGSGQVPRFEPVRVDCRRQQACCPLAHRYLSATPHPTRFAPRRLSYGTGQDRDPAVTVQPPLLSRGLLFEQPRPGGNGPSTYAEAFRFRFLYCRFKQLPGFSALVPTCNRELWGRSGVGIRFPSTDVHVPPHHRQLWGTVRVKCNEDDTIGDLKKLIAAQVGTRPEKIRIQKWYTVYKDHITLEDYEIHDGMGLEMYYN
ncbi:unnamed protein product [Scytosiphon promiscuus]